MSTETFLRLPEEKRNRVLDAAWEEFTRVRYFLNQADTPERRTQGQELAALLRCPAVLGSLQKGVYEPC